MTRILLALLAASLWSGAAEASYTIDLIWSTTGTPTLTLSLPDVTGNNSGACAAGALATLTNGRCLEMRLTAAAPLRSATVSVGWNTGFTGIALGGTGAYSVGPFGFFDQSRSVPSGVADVSPCTSIWSFCDIAYGSFGGASSTPVPAGVYTIGSVNIDFSTYRRNSDFVAFLQPGIDGVIDQFGNAAPVQVNGAIAGCLVTICIIPEPHSGGLLAAGVLGVGIFAGVRRRRNWRAN